MPAPPETPYLRPALLTAVASVIVTSAIAVVLVLLARGSFDLGLAEPARTAARTWLVSIGSGLDAGPVTLGLVPLGATVVCVALVACVAAWITSDVPDEPLGFAIATGGIYGVVAGIVSAASGSGDVTTSVIRATFGAFVVGVVGAAIGVSRRAGSGEAFWFTARPEVRAAVRAAVPAVAAVLAAASVIVVILLARNVDRAGDLWALLDPGLTGGLSLAVGCLLLLPTLVLWTTAALIGPGFALGTGTSVDLTGSQLGAVPGVPVLAALPDPGQFPEWTFALGLVPLAAGMLAGWRVDPGRHDALPGRVAMGAASGAVAGLALGVLVGISGGAVGPGRMVDAGPPLLTPLLVAVPVMAMGGALGAVLKHYRGGRATQPSDPSSPGRPRLGERDEPAGADRRVGGA